LHDEQPVHPEEDPVFPAPLEQ